VSTVMDGTEHTGSVALERGDDDLVAVHALCDQERVCPRGVLCIEPERNLRTALYA